MYVWNKGQQMIREVDYGVQGKMRKHWSESRSRFLLKSTSVCSQKVGHSHMIRFLKSYFKTAKNIHGWHCVLQVHIWLLGNRSLQTLVSPTCRHGLPLSKLCIWKPQSLKTLQDFQLQTPWKGARICGTLWFPDKGLGIGSWSPTSQRVEEFFSYFARKGMGDKGWGWVAV